MNKKLLQGDSVKNNFLYQFIYQFVVLVIPLVVSPYLTRTLGSEPLGIYTYTNSIAYYFVLVAMMGIGKHGQRIIAERKSDETALRKTFWSLFTFHLFISTLAFIFYLFYAIFLCTEDRAVTIAQCIYVLSACFDITWLYQGLEKFRTVVIRNAVLKVLECVAIFSFVKSSDDLLIYTIIMASSVCIGQFVLLPGTIKELPPVRFHKQDVIEHVKPMSVLFVAAIAATLYTVFDKTLLGLLSTKANVAFYEYANKIIAIPRTFITVISTVLFPRACQIISKDSRKEMDRNCSVSLLINFFIGFASIFGLLGIGNLLARIYFGEEFSICGDVIAVMSPVILIIGLGEIVRSLYIYPLKKDSSMVKILFLNATINVILSTVLIPSIGVYGAVIGTIAAELTGLVLEIWICKEWLPLKMFIKDGVPFFFIGLLMFLSIKALNAVLPGTTSTLLLEVLVGSLLYTGMTFVYCYYIRKDYRIYIRRAIDGVKNRIVR